MNTSQYLQEREMSRALDELERPIQDMPTLMDIEEACRGVVLAKAAGLDRIFPELFKHASASITRTLYPLYLKCM